MKQQQQKSLLLSKGISQHHFLLLILATKCPSTTQLLSAAALHLLYHWPVLQLAYLRLCCQTDNYHFTVASWCLSKLCGGSPQGYVYGLGGLGGLWCHTYPSSYCSLTSLPVHNWQAPAGWWLSLQQLYLSTSPAAPFVSPGNSISSIHIDEVSLNPLADTTAWDISQYEHHNNH